MISIEVTDIVIGKKLHNEDRICFKCLDLKDYPYVIEYGSLGKRYICPDCLNKLAHSNFFKIIDKDGLVHDNKIY